MNQSASLTFTGQTVASALQGAAVLFSNTLTNTGNGTDRFDITLNGSTFPAGTSFSLYQSDGVTPLTDSNGNGTPDTGPLAAGASYVVVLRAQLTPSATGGPYTVNKLARSVAIARHAQVVCAPHVDAELHAVRAPQLREVSNQLKLLLVLIERAIAAADPVAEA